MTQDPPSSPETLLARAASAERAGRWDDAASLCDAAFRAAWTGRDARMLRESSIRLAHVRRRARLGDEAVELFELAAVLGDLHDDLELSARAHNGLGIVEQERGHLSEAEAYLRTALQIARRSGSDHRIGDAEVNLGVIANIRGDLDAARRHYLTAREHLGRAGDERGCASALNNLGMLEVDRGDPAAAARHFDEALERARRTGDVALCGIVLINRVELFLARGEPSLARESCDEGFEIFSRLGHAAGKAEALKFYGIIYRETGKPHLAEIHLRQAVEIAGQSENPLLEAEAQREFGLVLRAQERNREALSALNRAHFLFSELDAASDHRDVSERIRRLESDFLSLVRAWGESIEAKDRYTGGHCERVAEYAVRIARRAGMPEREIVWFRMGAFLHDLGKTETPAEILNKPGRLTDEERLIMERHTVIGDEMLASVEFPWDIRPMVRSHHERWDGQGYPDRVAGDRIPFAARILRLADIYDALTSSRSYRRPLEPEVAFRIMEEDEGSFDPDLFEIFRELFPEFAEITRAAVGGQEEVVQIGRPR